MKKIISVLLTLALVLSLVPAVFAADEPTFSLSADKETAGAGDTVTLTVNFSNNGTILEIGGLNFEIIYDEEAYTFVSATPAKAYRPYFAPSSEGTSAGNGKLSVGGIITTTSAYPIELEDGELATYTFKANDVAAESASFKLDVKELNTLGTTPTPISNKTENGEITVPVTGGSVTPEGYSVSIPETKSVTTGETVEIPISISGKAYNAYSMGIRYYTDVLELQNEAVNNEGFRLSEWKGTDTNQRPFSSITLIRYGEVAEPGVALTLKFTAKAQGTTDVTIRNARVDERANSISFNAPDATVTNGTTAVTVSGYTVSLPDDFTRTGAEGTVILEGGNLTFKPKDPNYNYTVTVTVGGVAVTPTIGADGTYTVANVNGNVIVTSSKAAKSFNVTLSEDTTSDTTTATYMTAYTFKLTPVKDFVYDVKVTIGGTEYTDFTSQVNNDGTTTYTIPGAAITGDIVIDSNKSPRPLSTFQVTFEGTGIGDVSNNANTVKENDSYSFTLTKKDGFDYTVSATMGGAAVDLTETADAENANVVTCSIDKVTGDLVITVNKVSTLTMEVAVSEYVQMDDKTVFLVTVTGTPEEGKAYAYDGNVMYKTTAYGVNVYSWLVIVDKGQFTVDTAKANIKAADATAEEVTPSYDVNETNVVDINDAQLVYDIYSGKYTDFDKVSVRKFLRADVNNTKTVDATDAVAVVANSK